MNRFCCITIAFVLFLCGVSCEKKPPVPPAPEFEVVKVTPPNWDNVKRGDISYQLLVYSYADKNGDGWGDFQGIIDKLDYINTLGVSAIWLSPIHPCPSYHGYDVEDYAGINPKFGTMSDFRQLVDEAHKRGIKIYLDYVLNHTSVHHPWFNQAISSRDNSYRDYYIFSDNPQADIAAGNIPMIATEGAAGYDSGQWFTLLEETKGIFKFELNWSNASKPTVTVTKGDKADPDNPDNSAAGAKYLYFGDGVCRKFYNMGNNIYTLTVDFSSNWGFLIRTSDASSWPVGTKYGAQSSTSNAVTFGVPFTLYTSTASNDNVLNIEFAGNDRYRYHSHFWTNTFADLNYGPVASAETSPAFKAVTEAAKVWIDAGIDGFRLDAVKHIYHNEISAENPTFLKKFYDAVNTYYRTKHSENIYMVGEVFSEYNRVAPYYAGLPAYFDFAFWWRLSEALNSGKGNTFADNIVSYRNAYSAVRPDFIEATKLSNHDETRALSELGNSVAKAKTAAAMIMTAPGNPYIYYGEELGYPGTKSGGDEYVRSPMYWGDKYVTSYTDKIDASVKNVVGSVITQSSDSSSMLNYYKNITVVRNTYPALADGEISRHPISDAGVNYQSIAAWYMTSSSQRVLVLHNVGSSPVMITIEDSIKNAIFANGSISVQNNETSFRIMMGAYSSVVYIL
ncbi:MAG: alpha-amylase family glycosyl hydrolase [Bacteroidales bacterium]|nr:alpha-amylase family glycosyl hydrolase [Bacteroidales bacterium]MDD4671286.1 alpha-amylase family glycosyl hydrolase [Bacteroidales bacterium]